MRFASARSPSSNHVYEKHHIFPRSVYGPNDLVVQLTCREHYLAHKLLWLGFKARYGTKSTKTRKMALAFYMMVYGTGDTYRDKVKTSYMYESARKAAREAKIGASRPDMKGKSFFGASDEQIVEIKEKIRNKKLGIKMNYPNNRKSSPRSGQTAITISESRKRTKDKFVLMSDAEFNEWLQKFDKPTKSGRINSNVTRAIKWRQDESRSVKSD